MSKTTTDSVHWGKMSDCDYVLSSAKTAKWDEIITHASHSYSIKDMLENFSITYLFTHTNILTYRHFHMLHEPNQNFECTYTVAQLEQLCPVIDKLHF